MGTRQIPEKSRPIPEKFLVAFSFAGAQRELVQSIAEAVEERVGWGNVFFDDWFEDYIAGFDGDLRLQEIYGQKAQLVILCVSAAYNDRPWTLTEYAAIRDLRFRLQQSKDERDEMRILPLRVGDGDVRGVLFTTIAPDVRQRLVTQTAELIALRLGRIVPALKLAPAPVAGSRSVGTLATAERSDLQDMLTASPWFSTDARRHAVIEFLLMDDVSFGPFERHPDAASEVFALVERCAQSPRGWDALLDAFLRCEAPAELIEALAGKLQKFLPRPILWSEVTALKRLLRDAAVDDAHADPAFTAAARFATPDLRGAEGRHFWRYLECLASLPLPAGGPAPLLTFLELCADKLTAPDLVQPLADWKRAVAGPRRLNLDLAEIGGGAGLPPPSAARAAPAVLQIRLKPKDDAETSHRYEIMAWLRIDGKSAGLNLDDVQGAFASTALKPKIIGLVQQAMKRALRELRIEIIGTYELLEDEIDTWKLRVGVREEPLGARAPIVLRSYERLYDYDGDYSPAFPSWQGKWRQLRAPLTEPLSYWAEDAHCYDDLDGLYGHVEGALAFIGCVVPEQGGSAHFREALGQIVSAGVPLAAWLRGYQGDCQTARAYLETNLTKVAHQDWPKQMLNFRAQKTAPLHCRGISLLWDNPDDLPPDSPLREPT